MNGNRLSVFLVVATCAISLGCGLGKGAGGESVAHVTQEAFGKSADGDAVTLWTITNSNGLTAQVMDYGATMHSLSVPDRNGDFKDIILGRETAKVYAQSPYFGAIAGRYANRIAKGRFKIDGVEYKLETNNGENHLHGGTRGFDKVLWKGESFEMPNAAGVKFTYLSKDGEEGYPGNLSCTMTYTLNDENELIFDYEATTDKSTVLNLTQHNYYNLAGQGEGMILDHELVVNANGYVPVDAGGIPTGQIAPVAGTPFDFKAPTKIGARIALVEGGYDHNYALNRSGAGSEFAASVFDRASGRVMEIHTDQPGLQFYTGNFLDGTIKGKKGKTYQKNAAFCLETQKYPDSPNRPNFPSALLKPGETYRHHTVHRFSTRD